MTTGIATSSNSRALEGATFKRIRPRAYLERFIAEGLRPDGRSFNEFRNPATNVGSISTAHGSSLTRLGGTTVVCGIKVEVAEPDILAPRRGFVVPNVELGPICSPEFRPGPPSDEAQVVSSRIRNLLLCSDFLPLESLCIEEGRAVWVVYVDVVCLNYDGNILDASLLAAVSALKNTRLPIARYDPDALTAVASRTEFRPLDLQGSLQCASFAVFGDGTILTDPSAFEESVCEAFITIALAEDSTLRHVYQVGGNAASLRTCLPLAKTRCADLARAINAL